MTHEIISRDNAHRDGRMRFYTGKPCKKGHYSERYVSCGNCIACMDYKSPGRRQGVKATNALWALRPFIFASVEPPTDLEAEAVFNYVERAGWLDVALRTLREGGPTLIQQFANPITVADRNAAVELQERFDRQQRQLRGESIPKALNLKTPEGLAEYNRQIAELQKDDAP